MKFQTILVIGLVLCGALTPARAEYEDVDIPSDDYEEPDVDDSRALLIAHKHIKEGSVIQGQNLTTIITLINVGRGAATNVKVRDTALDPKKYKLIEGAVTRVIEAIPSGQQREVQYTYVPQSGASPYSALPASITYSPLYGQGHMTQTLLSTTPTIFIMTRTQAFRQTLLKIGRYATFGVLKTSTDWINSFVFIATTGTLVGGLAMYSLVTKSRADSRRRSAVKSLGADQ